MILKAMLCEGISCVFLVFVFLYVSIVVLELTQHPQLSLPWFLSRLVKSNKLQLNRVRRREETAHLNI